MPTVLRTQGYQFFFYAQDVFSEPPHVHVAKAGSDCKFWLQPVGLTVNHGFRAHELREIAGLIEEHHEVILRKWHEFFRSQS